MQVYMQGLLSKWTIHPFVMPENLLMLSTSLNKYCSRLPDQFQINPLYFGPHSFPNKMTTFQLTFHQRQSANLIPLKDRDSLATFIFFCHVAIFSFAINALLFVLIVIPAFAE